jgi:hypothetical protein
VTAAREGKVRNAMTALGLLLADAAGLHDTAGSPS